MVIITEEMLDAGVSDNGSFNNHQLMTLGLRLPLRHGWRKKLIGREVSEERYAKFLALKNKHLSPTGKQYKMRRKVKILAEEREREMVIKYLERLGLTFAAEGIHNLDHHKESEDQ